MFRTTICCAGLVMGVLIGLSEAAPAACEGDGCGSKPLNIMQFMREQAASTRVREPSASRRVAKSRRSPAQTTAAAPRAPHRAGVEQSDTGRRQRGQQWPDHRPVLPCMDVGQTPQLLDPASRRGKSRSRHRWKPPHPSHRGRSRTSSRRQ